MKENSEIILTEQDMVNCLNELTMVDDIIIIDELEDEFINIDEHKEFSDDEYISSMNELSHYLKTISDFEIMTKEEEFNFFNQYIDTKSKELKNELITRNLKLVFSIACNYKALVSTRYSLLDIVSEGNLALIKAVDNFNPSKGYRFSTYATLLIKRAIIRGIQPDKDLGRVPSYISTKIGKLRVAERKLNSLNSYKASNSELAKVLDWSEEEVYSLKNLMDNIKCISYDAPIGNEAEYDSNTILDMLSCENYNIEQEIENIERIRIVGNVLATLTTREREVISRRFGIGLDSEETLAKIGLDFKMTKESIRRIELKAMHTLRKNKNKSILKSLL